MADPTGDTGFGSWTLARRIPAREAVGFVPMNREEASHDDDSRVFARRGVA